MQNLDASLEAPLSRSYWVVPGSFLAGYYPGDRDIAEMDRKLKSLVDGGIRTFINLMEPDERGHGGLKFRPYDKRVKTLAAILGCRAFTFRHPVPDLCAPSRDQMRRILNRIDGSIGRGFPAYVHCWGGRGRTGAVVGCWLVRHGLAWGMDAITMISHLRRSEEKASQASPQTDQQIRMILDWGKGE